MLKCLTSSVCCVSGFSVCLSSHVYNPLFSFLFAGQVLCICWLTKQRFLFIKCCKDFENHPFALAMWPSRWIQNQNSKAVLALANLSAGWDWVWLVAEGQDGCCVDMVTCEWRGGTGAKLALCWWRSCHLKGRIPLWGPSRASLNEELSNGDADDAATVDAAAWWV